MTTSRVQIANIALTTYIGREPIVSLTQDDPNARQVNLHYDDTRQEILSEWAWSFATRRELLVRMGTNNKPEWRSRFAVPNGAISIQWVNDPVSAKMAFESREIRDTPRHIEGGFIYSDLEEASIEYTFDNDEPTTYPPKFVQAFAALLASKIAIPLVETASKAGNAIDQYNQYLDAARVYDHQQSPPILVTNFHDWSRG